jgi:hypothetical protein
MLESGLVPRKTPAGVVKVGHSSRHLKFIDHLAARQAGSVSCHQRAVAEPSTAAADQDPSPESGNTPADRTKLVRHPDRQRAFETDARKDPVGTAVQH